MCEPKIWEKGEGGEGAGWGGMDYFALMWKEEGAPGIEPELTEKPHQSTPIELIKTKRSDRVYTCQISDIRRVIKVLTFTPTHASLLQFEADVSMS
jgi:hypothetical protein